MTFLEKLALLHDKNPFSLAEDNCPFDFFPNEDQPDGCPLSTAGDWTAEQHAKCVRCWTREFKEE